MRGLRPFAPPQPGAGFCAVDITVEVGGSPCSASDTRAIILFGCSGCESSGFGSHREKVGRTIADKPKRWENGTLLYPLREPRFSPWNLAS